MRLSHLFRPSVFSVSAVGTFLALVVALGALLTAPLGAQTAKSRSQLYTDIDTNLPSTAGAITAAVLRTQLKNVVASAYNVVLADAQPLDSDLTAIAALTTTSFGRGLLTETSAATLKTTLSLNLVTNTADADKPVSTAQASAIAAAQAASQPLDADLTSIAALTTTSFGRSFLPLADASAGRTLLGLGSLATQSGTFSGTSSGTNTGDNAVNSLYSGLVSNATHTGDATGSTALTLATVNTNVGSFGSATAAPTFTVNAKGLITAAGSATITPAVGSITGLGTGVASALAVNVGTAGAPVVFNGAGGTPSSLTLTNATGLPAAGVTGLGSLATQSGTFSGTSSGTNTGDNAVNSLYSGLVSNATHTGDATGSTALTLATVNANVGSFGSATSAPTFTVNGKGLITAAGSATITPAVGSITGLGTGIAAALAINTGNSGAPVLIDGALGTPTSGVGTNLTALNATQLTSGTVPDARFPATLPTASGVNLTALNATQLTSGTVPDARFPATLPAVSGVNLTALNASNLGSGTVPAARFPAFTGEATTSAGGVAVTLTNSAVIGKVLTGYTSGAGTVAATDTILQAVQKLNGNAANLQPLDAELTAISGLAANGLIARTSASTAAARTLTGTAAELTVTNGDGVSGNPTLSLPAALTFTGKTITGGTYTSPTLTTPTIGDGSAAAPSLSFTSETTTGFFRPSASVLAMAVAGTSRATLTTTGMTVAGTITPSGSLHGAAGTVGNPALSFSGDQDTGLYHIGANNLGVAAGGAKVLDVATTGLGVTGTLSATGTLLVGSGATLTGSGIEVQASNFQIIGRSSATTRMILAHDGTKGKIGTLDNQSFDFLVNNAIVGTVASTGLAVTGALSSTGVYSTTTGSAANVFVDSAGLLQRSTSSLRYKTDLKPYERGLADAAKLNLFTYRAKDKPDSTERFAGVGAEEMDALGFTEFVEYSPVFEQKVFETTDPKTGEKISKVETVATKTVQPEAVRYANMVIWAFSCINELAAKNDSLRARVAQLEAQNQSLDARMAAVEALLKK